jgi:predicted ATPase
MVGRESQLETLRSLYGVVAAGRGRVAFLVGEPGIGKSRLLAEFQRFATDGGAADGPALAPDGDAGPTWIEGRCVSYGRNLPYHLLLDLVRFTLRLPLVASESEARATLDRQLAELLGDEAADTAPVLAHLPGPATPPRGDRAGDDRPRDDADPLHRLDPPPAARPVHAGTGGLVCGRALGRPSSVDLMRQLLPLAAQLPVFLIAPSAPRPTRPVGSSWPRRARLFGAALTEIRTEPLSATESRDLGVQPARDRVPAGSGARPDPRPRRGNPFFVEEVIRMLIGHGAIERRADRWIATGEVGRSRSPRRCTGSSSPGSTSCPRRPSGACGSPP